MISQRTRGGCNAGPVNLLGHVNAPTRVAAVLRGGTDQYSGKHKSADALGIQSTLGGSLEQVLRKPRIELHG